MLRDISLYLNVDEYERTYRSEFGFRSRYLCNFVRRHVASLKFRTKGFGSIAVQGCSHPTHDCPIRGEKVAVPTVKFDEQRYEALGADEHHEFFIGMLLGGLEKCALFHHIPLAEMKDAIEDFRAAGYRNEWTHQKKLLRPVGLDASLLCRMDAERFLLTLRLERKGTTVFEEAILETKPDETIFAFQFKDVVLEGRTVTVRDKFKSPTFSLDLSAFGLTAPAGGNPASKPSGGRS